MSPLNERIDIKTEDDRIVHPGDTVYNYYDMHPGVIELSPYEASKIISNTNPKKDIWFYVVQKDENDRIIKRALLNGERICTIEYARRRGFKDA